MKFSLLCCLVLPLFISVTSCVSKKKFAAMEAGKAASDKETKEYQDRLKVSALKNDSLMQVIIVKDSTIDSLNLKIAELNQGIRKEKPKNSSVKKASSLTKDQEYDKKSQFIYNFAAYIEWPVIYNGTDFVIGVEGDKDVIKKMQTILGSKKVGGKNLKIEKYNKVTKYHIVYITSSRELLFTSIRNEVKKNKTIIVTDDDSFSNSGANICFNLDDDRVRYTVNKASIEKIGLKVSQELMRFSE